MGRVFHIRNEEYLGRRRKPVQDAGLEPVLEARHITRNFGAVIALADASLSLRPREVLGLVGDNGAGKSTLLKILSGILSPTGGEIFIDRRQVHLKRAQDAMDAGIET